MPSASQRTGILSVKSNIADNGNGRRMDRKYAKNAYPVVKAVSVASKIVTEGVKLRSHRAKGRETDKIHLIRSCPVVFVLCPFLIQ